MASSYTVQTAKGNYCDTVTRYQTHKEQSELPKSSSNLDFIIRRGINAEDLSRVEKNSNMHNNSHSNDYIEEIIKLTDLGRCTINNKQNDEHSYDFERRSSVVSEGCRCDFHKKEDVYGKLITRKRVEADIYGGARQAADLKFKCIQDGSNRMEAIRRTMGVRLRAVAVVGLLFVMLATCTAAPTRARPTRSAHHEKSAVSFNINKI